MKTSNEKNSVATNPGKESATVGGSASAASQETVKTKIYKKKPIAGAIGSSETHFIEISNGLVNAKDVVGAIAIDTSNTKGLIILDKEGKSRGWETRETFDEVVDTFNSVVEKMKFGDEVLYVEDHCFIPFSLIKGVSMRSTKKGRFLVIDGSSGRALTMFSDQKFNDLDQLEEHIKGVLLKQLPNEMIVLSAD